MTTQAAGGGGSSGSRENDPLRTSPSLDGTVMYVDIEAEQKQLYEEEQWRTIGRNAMTLVKYPDMRIVLEVMKQGARIEQHRTEGRVAIQVLSGRIRLRVGDEDVELPAGRLLTLDRMVPHDVEALEQSAFLLWVSWTEDRETAQET